MLDRCARSWNRYARSSILRFLIRGCRGRHSCDSTLALAGGDGVLELASAPTHVCFGEVHKGHQGLKILKAKLSCLVIWPLTCKEKAPC